MYRNDVGCSPSVGQNSPKLAQARKIASAKLFCHNQDTTTMNVAIARVETFPILYPSIGRFKFLQGPNGQPMGRPTVLVKVTADDGTVGWGQCVPSPRWSYETPETVLSTIQNYLMPELIGRDPLDVEAIHATMNRAIAPSFSTGQPICKAGVDLALFDLIGKLLKQTAAERWQRKGHGQVMLSWTVNPQSLDEVEKLMAQGHQRGYRNFNIKIAPDPTFDLELCRLVRNLASDSFLWVDANGGYDQVTALAMAPKLADLGVDVFEQPLPANRLDGYRQLKSQGALPIIMDEGVVSHVELEEFIKLNLLDGVAIKPARCGGLTEARRQIEILLDRGLLFLGSGLTEPDVSLAGSLALFDAYDLKYPAALNGPQFLGGTVLKQPIVVEQGQAIVPSGAGLGVEIDEANLHPQ
jgi:L-alanine-DL-glutamate epimerase-like enolase superfamily enzyme